MAAPVTRWSAPVRYAEADQQGVVFNAHYLTYCDEAMGAFCAERELGELVERVRLVTSTLTWSAPARWGDMLAVDARCARVGTTSITMHFEVTAGGRPCCEVETVYVLADASGTPEPVPAHARDVLLGG